MPQNMERRPKVARLELDENEEQETEILEAEVEEVERLSDEEYYEITLKHLQHGKRDRDIANALVSAGMSRIEAKKMVRQVAIENPEIGQTNAYILLGAGAVFVIPGLILSVMSLMNAGTFKLNPYMLLVFIGGWFLLKGFQAYRKAG